MKKLFIAAILSMFSVSAAHACDGMKDHAKSDATQSQKDAMSKKDSKASSAKTEAKTDKS